MAEHGAHLTSAGVGAGSDDVPPSIFEVLAQENLMSTLRPALQYACKVAGENRPAQLGWMLRFADEIYVLLDLVIERYYLKHYSASFAENFYGLKRTTIGQTAEQQLPKAKQLKSLIYLTLVPYLKHKCEQLYESRNDAEQQATLHNQSLRSQLYRAFIAVYPLLHLTWQSAFFIFQLLYVFHRVRCHSPLLKAAGVQLQHLTREDIEFQSQPRPPLSLADKTVLQRVASVMSYGSGGLAVALSSGLSVGVFFLQFLEWWYASDQHATSLTALPVPPPPQKQQFEGLPKMSSICPLCHKLRSNDTALAVSGFVFCYPCIYRYVQHNHNCPITSYPASTDHLVKLYLTDS